MTTDDNLRDRLRIATRTAHDRLDRSLDLGDGSLDRLSYMALLSRFHGLHAAAEPRLAHWLAPTLLQGRQKLPAIEQDLVACGLDPVGLQALPAMTGMPPIDTRGGALGLLYVIEGSTLGSRVIARHVQRDHSIPRTALRFLTIYGNDTGARWGAVCDHLNAEADPVAISGAIATASAVFDRLAEWLGPSSIRHEAERMVGATGIEPVTPTVSR